MSTGVIFRPPNTLGSVTSESHGLRASELVATAQRNVVELKPKLQEALRNRCEVLSRAISRPAGDVADDAEALETAALSISELAAACDNPAASAAAQGVYAMVTTFRKTGAWHSDALNAHVSALHLLAAGSPSDQTDAAMIIERLSAMRAFLGVGA